MESLLMKMQQKYEKKDNKISKLKQKVAFLEGIVQDYHGLIEVLKDALGDRTMREESKVKVKVDGKKAKTRNLYKTTPKTVQIKTESLEAVTVQESPEHTDEEDDEPEIINVIDITYEFDDDDDNLQDTLVEVVETEEEEAEVVEAEAEEEVVKQEAE